MEMSMGLRLGMKHEIQLTMGQRLAIDNEVFSRRMGLMETLHGERYEPRATCPKCEYGLSPAEILKGFNQDPQDFRTTCPKCKHRFEAKLRQSNIGGYAELPFYCPSQTLDQLRRLKPLPVDEFKKEHPAVYNSAKVHFGSLKAAFEMIGVTYPFDVLVDWKEKILAFLGQLPDTVIAACVNVKSRVVRLLRKKHGIAPFRRSALA